MIAEPLKHLDRELVRQRFQDWNLYEGEPVQMRHGFSLRLQPGCDYSRRRFVFRVAEPVEIDFLLRNFRSELYNSVCVDVGANVGYHTLALINLFRCREVYAFEPSPRTFEILSTNVQGLRAARPVSSALGSVTGSRPFFVDASDTGDSRLANAAGAKTVSVSVTTLDEFVIQERIEALNFLKVDIQGGEPNFFKGAQKSLERHRPLILCEVMSALNTSINKVLLDLAQRENYKIMLVDGRETNVLDSDAMRNYRGSSNVFLIPNERFSRRMVENVDATSRH